MEHKEFNYEHAVAGAPVCMPGLPQAEFKIYNWAHKGHSTKTAHNPYLILGEIVHCGLVLYWNKQGRTAASSNFSDLSLAMAPLGYLQGRPVYADDDLFGGGNIYKVKPADRQDDFVNFVWAPLVPAFKLPGMTWLDFFEIGSANLKGLTIADAEFFADWVLRQALTRGLVELPMR